MYVSDLFVRKKSTFWSDDLFILEKRLASNYIVDAELKLHRYISHRKVNYANRKSRIHVISILIYASVLKLDLSFVQTVPCELVSSTSSAS